MFLRLSHQIALANKTPKPFTITPHHGKEVQRVKLIKLPNEDFQQWR